LARSGEITDPCPVPRSLDPVFQDTRFEPFTDQADDARVTDPVFDETDEPVLAHRIEKPGNVGVQNVVHLSAVDPDMERIQRIVLAAARAESIAEPEEFLLVDRIQQRSGGPLDKFVLKGGDCQRALPPIGLRNVPTPRGLRPIGSPMDPIAQIFDPAIEIGFVVLPPHPVDTRSRVPLQCEKRGAKHCWVEVVEERGEPLPPSLLCGLPYALQRL
jgi:hypothetical protein